MLSPAFDCELTPIHGLFPLLHHLLPVDRHHLQLQTPAAAATSRKNVSFAREIRSEAASQWMGGQIEEILSEVLLPHHWNKHDNLDNESASPLRLLQFM